MIDSVHVVSLLKILGIQRKYWRVVVELSVLASARAFHVLHTVRFGGHSDVTLTAFDPENSDSERDDSEDSTVIKRKSCRSHFEVVTERLVRSYSQ